MTRFAGLKDDLPQNRSKIVKDVDVTRVSSDVVPSPSIKRRSSRDGKKGILGHFSPELSRALNIMAIEEGSTVQALMGEAFDLLMRARGKHPFGER